MWTRTIIIVGGCLIATSVFSAPTMAAEGVETIPTPAPYQQYRPQPTPSTLPVDMGYESQGSPPTYPWYYWWSSWHWFDRCVDRGQHYAYLPPLPGWYYFRPYSVAQLRAQQEAVIRWGGDPRNPYAPGILPEPDSKPVRRNAVAAVSTTSSGTSYEIVASHTTPVSPPPRVSRSPRVSSPPVSPPTVSPPRMPQPKVGIIPWPTVLCDQRFAFERARIEDPYRLNHNGQAVPTAADYQDIINAAARMKVTLWQMTAEISPQESNLAEKFLDQLATEARGQLQIGMAAVRSESL